MVLSAVGRFFMIAAVLLTLFPDWECAQSAVENITPEARNVTVAYIYFKITMHGGLLMLKIFYTHVSKPEFTRFLK